MNRCSSYMWEHKRSVKIFRFGAVAFQKELVAISNRLEQREQFLLKTRTHAVSYFGRPEKANTVLKGQKKPITLKLSQAAN